MENGPVERALSPMLRELNGHHRDTLIRANYLAGLQTVL